MVSVISTPGAAAPPSEAAWVAFRSVFSALLPEGESYFLKCAERRLYEPGEVIIRQADTCQGIHVINSGDVRVELERSPDGFSGEVVELANLEAGDIFGEMAFVDDEPACATLIANDAVEILFISKQMLQGLLVGDPTFGSRFYRSIAATLAQRLRDTNVRIEMVPRSKTVRH
jgi:CRP/FNR family cyclic AMP-dependent transcriptional regulator